MNQELRQTQNIYTNKDERACSKRVKSHAFTQGFNNWDVKMYQF